MDKISKVETFKLRSHKILEWSSVLKLQRAIASMGTSQTMGIKMIYKKYHTLIKLKQLQVIYT